MKLKSITIEGMHNVSKKTYDLSQLNYLHGPNGAGKSTVLEAIQFGLLGYVPSTGKTNVIQHANGKVLSVTLKIDNNGEDVTISRTLANVGKSTTSDVSITPEGFDIAAVINELELPIFNFDEFKGMTANKLKDWFIQFLGNSGGNIDWEEELSNSVQDIAYDGKADVIKEFIPESSDKPALEVVREVNAKVKESLSFAKELEKRATNTVQSLVHYDDVASDLDTDALESELSELDELKSSLIRYDAVNASNEHVHKALTNYEIYKATNVNEDDEYIKLKSQAEELKQKAADSIYDIDSDIVDEVNQLRHKYTETKYSTINSAVCPFTKQECETAGKYVEESQAKLKAVEDELNAAEAKLTEEQLKEQEAMKTANEYKGQLNDAIEKMNQLVTAYKEKAMLESKLTDCDAVPPTTMTVDEIDAKISALRGTIQKANANKIYDKMIDEETKKSFAQQMEIQIYKAWDKLTGPNGLQTKLMTEPFEKFAADIDKYLKVTLGNKVTAHFNLSEKANSFSFGIMRDDEYVAFDLLSSGEKCLFTLALMMCIVSRSETDLKLILVDDLFDHLDDKNIDKLFDALEKVKDIQFVLAGVKECNSKNKDNIVINI